MRSIRLFLLMALLAFAPASFPKGTSSRGSGHSRPARSRSTIRSNKCSACARNSKGRIARSSTTKHEFQRTHPCPSTGRTSGACPGYVVDHKTALKRGGSDTTSNMQWQTKAEAKAKDKVE